MQNEDRFQPVDVKKAVSRLRLEKNATKDGLNNIPDINSESKDLRAIEIDDYIFDQIAHAQKEYHANLTVIEDNTTNQLHGLNASINDIKQTYEDAKVQLQATADLGYEELCTAKEKCVEMGKQYDTFKEKYGLSGPAVFPKEPVSEMGWIFVIAVMEILFNALALGFVHPDGPLGVTIEISMHAIANVGTAFLLGFFVWRWLHPIAPKTMKTRGYLIASPMIFFVVFINFFLAHYRDAIVKLVTSSETADLQNETLETSDGTLDSPSENLERMESLQKLGHEAMNGLIDSPLSMTDFKSYLLLFVGILFAVVAAIKAYSMDDPFPGFGKLQRKKDDLANDLQRKKEKHVANMSNLVKNSNYRMSVELSRIKQYRAEVARSNTEAHCLFEQYSNWLMAVQPVGEALYAFYRQVNLNARKIKEVPVSYNRHKYNLPELPRIKAPAMEEIKELDVKVEEDIEKFLEELNRYRQQLVNIVGDQ